MKHNEICGGRLIIINFDNEICQTIERLPRLKSLKASVILEDLGNGTYVVLKNGNGNNKIGEVVEQKAITKFILRDVS